MNCIVCGSELKNKYTTYMVDVGKYVVIVKNVPSQVCSVCEGIFYTDEVKKKLKQIIDDQQKILTSVVIVRYPNKSDDMIRIKAGE